ncbi:MAG TPA: class I SAM-dependent methyltransferase [Acidobacteriota bacterium]|nr:class I SAM-dependent methyltransferase [Acidobacteriota bacterium]
MLSDTQLAGLESLKRRYPDYPFVKFFVRPEYWEGIAYNSVRHLGLDRPPRRRILDLGSSVGYFVLVACRHGHDVTGIDIPDAALSRAARIIGAPYVEHTIAAYQPLPEDLTGFDLVTMFGVNLLSSQSPKKYFDQAEYGFLTEDVRRRLNPGGRWVIRPNVPNHPDESSLDRLFDREWWRVTAPQATCEIKQLEVTLQWE